VRRLVVDAAGRFREDRVHRLGRRPGPHRHLSPPRRHRRLLRKIRAGGSLLLLATSFPGADNAARAWHPETATWAGYMEQPLDLCAPPFSLGVPLESFPEQPGPWGVLAVPRELTLWRINEVD
jgi:hypothetical protein